MGTTQYMPHDALNSTHAAAFRIHTRSCIVERWKNHKRWTWNSKRPKLCTTRARIWLAKSLTFWKHNGSYESKLATWNSLPTSVNYWDWYMWVLPGNSQLFINCPAAKKWNQSNMNVCRAILYSYHTTFNSTGHILDFINNLDFPE